jgi:hypothetical protein
VQFASGSGRCAAQRAARLEEDQPAMRSEAAEWPEVVVVASGINVLAATWLLLAPYLLPGVAPAWNEILCGSVIFVLALARVTVAWSVPALSYVNVAMGALLMLTGFWSNAAASGVVTDVLVGLAVALLALLSASTTPAGASRSPTPVSAGDPRPRATD